MCGLFWCFFLTFFTSALTLTATLAADSEIANEVCWEIGPADVDIKCTTEGYFLKPHSNCQSYYRCAKIGQHLHSFEFDCDKGSIFNLEKSACVSNDSLVLQNAEFLTNCTTGHGLSSDSRTKRELTEPIDVRDSKLQETISMLTRKRCRSESNVFVHPVNCSKYIACKAQADNGEVKEVEMNCPSGQMYDEYAAGSGPCVEPTSMSPKARCFPEAEKMIEAIFNENVDPDVHNSSYSEESDEYSIPEDTTPFFNLTNSSSTTSGLDPSIIFAFFSNNHEIAIMICVLLLILLVTTCFFCCYMLRSIYHCVFLKSPAKSRGTLKRNSRESHRNSSRRGSNKSKSSSAAVPASFIRFPSSTANFIDENRREDPIELKSVMFINAERDQDPPGALFPLPPHKCSTFEIRGPQLPATATKITQHPWQIEQSTSVSTDVIVNVNQKDKSSIKRKRVEIYIPNLNLPNAVEPLHIKTIFEDMDMDMDEHHFGALESKCLNDEDLGGDYEVIPGMDAIYDAVIPKSQRVAHVNPFTTTELPENVESGKEEKRLSTFGTPIMTEMMSTTGAENKKSSIIMDPLDHEHVVEYFF